MDQFNVVGIGEILWDMLPEGRQLGGAPANFAFVSGRLGNRGILLSRVGDDADGRDIESVLADKNLDFEPLQTDAGNPTGTVGVRLENGHPEYDIRQPAAWDFLELTDDWCELATTTDAVCFGTLAQRNAVSRRTILEFVGLTKGLRVFDVNLRQNFYNREIIRRSLNLANIVKLNHEELPIVASLLGIEASDTRIAARALISAFGLRLVCVTRGDRGSLLISRDEISESTGVAVEIADTIGAGDAFTAALTHGLLRGWDLFRINEFANRTGAFIASRTGAMPADLGFGISKL